MTTERYTANQLAGMPGMPNTPRGINKMGDRGEIERSKKAQGKGWEYHLSSLPQATQNALIQKAVTEIAVAAPAEPPVPVETKLISELKSWQLDVAKARLLILTNIDEIAIHTSKGKALDAFIKKATNNELHPETLLALQKSKNKSRGKNVIDRASIYRWRKNYSDGGLAALAPAHTGRKATYCAWKPYFLKLYQQPQKPTIARVVRDWEKHYPDIEAPTNQKAAERFIKSLPVEIAQYGRMLTRARRSIQPFVRRTTDGLWPMDVVTVDGHLFKAYVRHPKTGRRFRPEVTTYLDVATRKAIGFSAWINESQYAIWMALHDMVLNQECGVPAIHYSDNGAYRGDQHKGTMNRLGTTMMFSQAWRAQARGLIERFNSSVWIPLAKNSTLYCGKDVDQEYFQKALKKADEDSTGLIGWEDFLTGCKQAIAEYNNHPHCSIKNQTPNQAWKQALDEGWKPTKLEHDDLHDLLPAETRKVSRGEVSLPWGRYFSKELRSYHGDTVRVAFQPTEGDKVWVSAESGELLCIAKRDANAKPYVTESMLDHAHAKREKGRVNRLETKLDAVREEGAALIEAKPADPTIIELAKHGLKQIQEEMEAEPAFRIPDGDPERYELWKELDTHKTSLNDDENAFYQRFKEAGYCRAMREMEAEFAQSMGN